MRGVGHFGEKVAQKESFFQILYCFQLLSQSKSPCSAKLGRRTKLNAG